MAKKWKKPSKSLAVKVLAVQVASWLSLPAHAAAIFLAIQVDLFPDRDSLLNIISSFAEIIAGLYGITAAGYTFFLSRMDALMASDATLGYVVASVKRRFQGIIVYITAQVIMVLLMTLILMYVSAPSGGLWLFLYRLGCNEFLLFVTAAVCMILCYSLWVIDPKCIEKEAAKQKKKLSDPAGEPGSAADFIALYDRLEVCCSRLLPKTVVGQLVNNKGNDFTLAMELLEELRPDLGYLVPDLTRIHQYYQCMINCRPMTVTEEMCTLARNTLAELEAME